MYNDGLIIKTRKLSPKEVKKKFRDFIDEISEDCGPEIDQMADELKNYGDQFVDAISGYGSMGGANSQFRNNGEGFRNGGGFSHSSFRGNGGNGSMSQRGEFRDDVPGMGGTDWNEKEQQRLEENRQKMEQLEAEMKRLKMRVYGNS